jgi:hypothetical protein
MRVLDAGHDYELMNLDGSGVSRLTFVKRQGERYPGNVGFHEGTTSQEVLRALIHRAAYVYNQIPCWQTKLAIYLQGFVIWLYEHRAARIHRRRVPGLHEAVYGIPCPRCGHQVCEGECGGPALAQPGAPTKEGL